jgi:hypothetical protein
MSINKGTAVHFHTNEEALSFVMWGATCSLPKHSYHCWVHCTPPSPHSSASLRFSALAIIKTLIQTLLILVGSVHVASKVIYLCPAKSGIDIISSSLGLLAARYPSHRLLLTNRNSWPPSTGPNWTHYSAPAMPLAPSEEVSSSWPIFCWSGYFFFLIHGLLTSLKRPILALPSCTSPQSPREFMAAASW